MSILDLNFENVKEAKAIESINEEHELRVVEVEAKLSQKGLPMLVVRFESTEDPYAKDVMEYFMLPTDEDDAKKRNQKLLSIQYFYEALGVNYKSGPVNLDELVGKTCWVLLKLEESDQYGASNRIKRYIASR